jgi:hypothetical protein
MSLFSKSGNVWHPHREAALNLQDRLPAGTYTVKQNQMTQEFYLEAIDSFTLPDRIYGDIARQTNRIIRSFSERPAGTGVLLVGEKGSGKTLLSKNVCMNLQRVGVPTIVINHPWHGDEFNAFIQTIEQPAVILFDEFEKNYKREVQEQLLTLLDGVFPSKKLFMLTCNDQYRIDSHMRNRPGRIYYFVKFAGLGEEFVEEYCQDNLLDTQYIEKIVQISKMYGQFNFDMLQSLVEEMNRFDEDPIAALEMLNAKPEEDGGGKYAVQIIHEGLVYEGKDIDEGSTFTGNPLVNDVDVGIYLRGEGAPGAQDDEDDDNPATENRKYLSLDFTPEDFVRFDPVNGQFVFQNDKAMCILTRVRERARHNMLAF